MDTRNNYTEQKPKTRGFFTGTLSLALMSMLLGACVEETPDEVAVTEDQIDVSTEEVADEPENYIGQTITIRSNVEELVAPTAFTVSDEQFFDGDEILIINTSGEPFTLPEDDMDVQVTGEVQLYRDIDFEADYGIDPGLEAEYSEYPTIVADSLALAPDPGEITENPDMFYNLPIAVQGEVEAVQSPFAFTLEDNELIGGGNLLVFSMGAPPTPLRDDETVVVTGEVRPFILSEFERDYDLQWDLQIREELEAEYSEQPVLVADDIYTLVDEE